MMTTLYPSDITQSKWSFTTSSATRAIAHNEDTLDFNPSIIGIAENLRYAREVETPTDYFGEAKELMRRSAVGIEYPRDPDTQTLGGEPFEVLYARMSTPTGKISQRYFARRFDDYMVLIIVSHETEEQAATIDASLATLRFVEPAPPAEGR